MATPTPVQHVLYNSNETYQTGNAFKLQVPNATLAGNCLVLFMSYAYSSSRTVTVTDNIGNTWPSTPTLKTDDTSNNVTTAVFILPGAAAGVTQITVTFNAALYGFNPSFSEWYNVATVSAIDGAAAANLIIGSPVASGSFNTAIDGDLILHFGINTAYGDEWKAGQQNGVTTITKNSGYTLLHANWAYCNWLQYQVQSSHGATNPAITLAGGISGDSFNTITIALKAAAAGTAPSNATARVFGLMHQAINVPSSTNYVVWMPHQGSAIALGTTHGSTGSPINSATGSVSGSWTLVKPGSPSNYPQWAYVTGQSPSDTDVLTLNLSTGSSGNIQHIVYDIVNAGSYDTYATGTHGSFGPGTVNNMPDITPGVSSGITLAACGFYTGPPDTISSPTGAVIDSGMYTGYSDLSPWDTGDGWGHYVFTSNAAQSWSWHDTEATSGADVTAIIFAYSAPATIDQQAFRFYNDNGTET